ncbi:MAG: IclR family transcriptional regulator [Acidobacteria bacterium]|nr:IclR family transcriptional regulator [Acidobacteriota bacterium]
MRKTLPKFAGVRVLHKAMDVLESLGASGAGMALGELAAAVGMPKPTVYRIVATLEARGYVGRSAEGRYRLSRRIVELQSDGAGVQRLLQAARPEMRRLVESCKETVNLGVLDGGEVVVIETIESPQTVRMSSKIGNRRYPHSTALGKILLAALPEKEVLRILRSRKMPRLTANTIISERNLLVELERVRQQGYAFDNRENEPDGRCLAAPVFGPGRAVAAALSISGPLPRMTVSRARSFLKRLCEACRAISAAAGGGR